MSVSRVRVGISPVRPEGTRVPRHVDCRVAVVDYGFPQPGCTLVVSVSCSFADGDGPFRGTDYVSARALTRGSQASDGDVLPDDLVPFKPETDVLLVGSLDLLPLPSGTGAVRRSLGVRVGAVELELGLSSAVPGRYPLRAPWLELVGGGSITAVPTPDPTEGAGRFPEGFDYSVFQAAPPAARTPHPTEDMSIRLRGVDGAEEWVTVALPKQRPRAFVDWREAGSNLQEAPLELDTVIVDLEAKLVHLTWRGNVEALAGSRAIDRLIVGFIEDETWEERGMSPILRELPRGRFSHAYSLDDVTNGTSPPALRDEEVVMMRCEAMSHPQAPLPTLTLEEHAAIAAELLDVPLVDKPAEPNAQTPTRAGVLAAHDLDEFAWGLEERWLAEALATVNVSDDSIHGRWARAFAEALARRTRPREHEIIATDYADLVVAMETNNPHEVLADAKLTLGSWLRLDKKWQAAMLGDAGVRREVEARVAARRSARSEQPA